MNDFHFIKVINNKILSKWIKNRTSMVLFFVL
jgi:hypothetical protein